MRLLRIAAATSLVAGLAMIGATTAQGVSASSAGGAAYTQTKHLTRSFMQDGAELVVDERDVTVTASRTTELRGRERIDISWSGAHPTGGRTPSPFGEKGLSQEYPVVILQCRGVDDASLPAAQQLSPSTCWTSTRQQRSQFVDDTAAVWRHDLYATDVERARKTPVDPLPAECGDQEIFSSHTTPFISATGTSYLACTEETMPPEAAVGAAFPPAEMAAFTDSSGAGSVKFEVRSDIENESLGCNDKTDCAIVVIPIEGISCVDDDRECRKAGVFESGASNFGLEGVDASVSPYYWWSPSNWRNRFTIPLHFGLAPDACDVLDSRPPTGFYGTELLSQASLQWSPAYCLNKKRFKFQHNKMSDDAAFSLMEGGGGAAALVSGEHEVKGTDPVVYAPTAVSALSIAYVIDKPDNAGEYTDLKLNARLLAKLLTQSYLGSEKGRGHPGMSTNPVSINMDPEFQALNPGLDVVPREAAAPLLALSENSDLMGNLTSYIAADKDALAFVNGTADPWGMKVNPSYAHIKLPESEWPLLDDYVPPTNDECEMQNPSPYFTKLAAPVTSLRKIAEAVLDSWPNVQTKCTRASVGDPWKIGRVDRQGVGSRFMLGLVTAGDAERFGLREAALQTKKDTFIAPTNAGMSAAVAVAEPSKSGNEPFDMAMDRVVRAGNAYPGTMIVYTATRSHGLPPEDAAKVSEFIKIASTEGQTQGFGNGELPPGYLPLARTGPTAGLLKQAARVAVIVADQSGSVEGEGGGESDDGGVQGGGAVGGNASGSGLGSGSPVDPGSVTHVVPGSTTTPSTPTPGPGAGKPAKGKPAKTPTPEPVAMPETEPTSSAIAGQLIPVLLVMAVLSAMATSLLRLGLARRKSS